MADEVKQLLLTFAKFEKDGTLPNTIHGEDVSNRDTSDAPLWFALACEELAALECCDMSQLSKSGDTSRTPNSTMRLLPLLGGTIRDVLTSIAENYASGTPNGIRMDPGLGADLESKPFHVDGHQLSRLHAARRLSG